MTGGQIVLGLWALLSELALWTGCGVALWRLARPFGLLPAIALTVVGVAALLVGWALFLAPGSPRRMGVWARVIVASSLMLLTALLLSWSGLPRFGIALAVVGVAAMAVTQPLLADL